MNETASQATQKENGALRALWPPVVFALLIGLAGFGVRVLLPASDPFENYFEQYLRTGGEGRGHNIPARVAQLGARGGERLQELLATEDLGENERVAAIELAGYSGDKRLAPMLVPFADPANPATLRVAALQALARLESEVAGGLLVSALTDPSGEIRFAALEAVSPGVPAAVSKAVARRAEASEGDERARAIVALGRAGGSDARLALWKLYNDPLPLPDRLAAKRALEKMKAPGPAEAAALAHVAEGYLPVAYGFSKRSAFERLERRLRTMLTFRVEELMEEETETASCESEEECRARHRYYRDLVRRKTNLRVEVEGFEFLARRGVGAEPLLFTRTAWMLKGQVQYLSLSMVRQVGLDPAIFPVRELGFDTFWHSEETGGGPLPALGEVLEVRGSVKRNDLEVIIATPLAGIPTAERYRFEGGVFVPAGSGS